jgi:hypothetical protein
MFQNMRGAELTGGTSVRTMKGVSNPPTNRAAMKQDGFSAGAILAIGVAIGTAIGVAMHNIGAGVGIGALVAGAYAATNALVRIRRGRL